MGHRQHFTFNLAPEVAHNQNFSLKDNRGNNFYFFFTFNVFLDSFCVFLRLWSLSLSLSHLSLEIRSKRNQMDAHTTLQKAAGALNLSHTQMHACPAGYINCSGVSVRLYIYLWGVADWIKCWVLEGKLKEINLENGSEKKRERKGMKNIDPENCWSLRLEKWRCN